MVGDLNCAGGQERVMTFWGSLLRAEGREVTFVDETGGPSFYDLGQNKIEKLTLEPDRGVKKNPLFLVSRCFRFWKWLRPKSPSVLVMTKSVYLSVFPFLRFFPGMSKHRFIYYSHSSTSQFLGRFPAWLVPIIFSGIDQLVCLYDDAVEKPAWMTKNLHLLPNPSPFAVQPPPAQKTSVLSLGRLSPEKGLDLLLRVWAVIEQEPSLDSWSLQIVGDGPEEKSLKQLARDLQLRRVEWKGATTDVAPLYGSAGIFVMTSHFEGLPMVLLEALSFGLPVVSTSHTGAQLVMTEDLKTGLIESRDPKKFYEALAHLMKNQEAWKKQSHASLLRAADFQPQKALSLWESILNAKRV